MKRISEFLIDPNHAVRIHAVFGLLWLIIGTPVTVLWLSSSVSFIAWMSLYAIVVAHWSGLQGALSERRVKDEGDEDE